VNDGSVRAVACRRGYGFGHFGPYAIVRRRCNVSGVAISNICAVRGVVHTACKLSAPPAFFAFVLLRLPKPSFLEQPEGSRTSGRLGIPDLRPLSGVIYGHHSSHAEAEAEPLVKPPTLKALVRSFGNRNLYPWSRAADRLRRYVESPPPCPPADN